MCYLHIYVYMSVYIYIYIYIHNTITYIRMYTHVISYHMSKHDR